MNDSIRVLDHGFVRLVEPYGTGDTGAIRQSGSTEPPTTDYECGIIEAARQSTQGAFRGWEPALCTCDRGPKDLHHYECATKKNPGDLKLLTYLYEHKHNTPFEFAGMVIEVQAPIFVFREWHRHRTQSYNEMSARYEPLPDLYYQPAAEHILERAQESTTTRQARAMAGVALLNEDGSRIAASAISKVYNMAELYYQDLLQMGVPKELARLVMPVGHYSKMRAAANLRNWLAFMTLRCDPNAQWEIRQYAEAVATLVERTFPHTHQLWLDEGLE